MDWFIKHDLNKLAHKADPDPKFVRTLEKRLRAKVGHPLWWVSGWKWGVGAAATISLIGSATGVYAYTSDNVLPNHPLYPVRIAIEKVQEAVAASPEQKAKMHAKNLERRYHENELMKKRQERVTQGMVKAFDQGLSEQLDENAKLPTAERDSLDQKVAKLKKAYEMNVIPTSTVATTTPDISTNPAIENPQLNEINKKIQTLDPARKKNFETIKNWVKQEAEDELDRLDDEQGEQPNIQAHTKDVHKDVRLGAELDD